MSYRNFSIDTGIDLYGQKDTRWSEMSCFGSTVGEVGCSLVCTAMCVNKTPKTLVNDGWGDTRWMMWKDAVKDYGYKIDTTIDYNLHELFDVLNDRRAPIIVSVHSNNPYGGKHFVVISEFNGKLGYDPQGGYYGVKKSMFTVYDPCGRNGEINKLSDYDVIDIIGQVY